METFLEIPAGQFNNYSSGGAEQLPGCADVEEKKEQCRTSHGDAQAQAPAKEVDAENIQGIY